MKGAEGVQMNPSDKRYLGGGLRLASGSAAPLRLDHSYFEHEVRPMLGSIPVPKGRVSHTSAWTKRSLRARSPACASVRRSSPGAGCSSPSSPPHSRSRPASVTSILSAILSTRRRRGSCRSRLRGGCSPSRSVSWNRDASRLRSATRQMSTSKRWSECSDVASTSWSASARRSRTHGVTRLRALSKGAATLLGVDRALLQRRLTERGEPAYRAEQVWDWAARGVTGYSQMTNLPGELRTELEGEVPFSTLELEREAEASDGTVKALFRTQGGHAVEA